MKENNKLPLSMSEQIYLQNSEEELFKHIESKNIIREGSEYYKTSDLNIIPTNILVFYDGRILDIKDEMAYHILFKEYEPEKALLELKSEGIDIPEQDEADMLIGISITNIGTNDDMKDLSLQLRLISYNAYYKLKNAFDNNKK